MKDFSMKVDENGNEYLDVEEQIEFIALYTHATLEEAELYMFYQQEYMERIGLFVDENGSSKTVTGERIWIEADEVALVHRLSGLPLDLCHEMSQASAQYLDEIGLVQRFDPPEGLEEFDGLNDSYAPDKES